MERWTPERQRVAPVRAHLRPLTTPCHPSGDLRAHRRRWNGERGFQRFPRRLPNLILQRDYSATVGQTGEINGIDLVLTAPPRRGTVAQREYMAGDDKNPSTARLGGSLIARIG